MEVTGAKPEFVVHPPIGKWCIALGIKIFGDNPFGWRIAVATAGALAILLVAKIAQQLFHSTALSTLAALLMSLDGLNLVHSRTALLDLFLTLFVLLAVNAWLKDHYWQSGIWFGLAIGTKWSGLYFLVAFGAVAIFRDRKRLQTWTRILATRFSQFFILPIGIYIASWTGWFLSSRGYDRQWATDSSSWKFIPAPLRSFWHYHAEILNFHTHLVTPHNYQANPWSWLIMGRPTSFYYASPDKCGVTACAQEIMALGTPVLWWGATIALAVVFGYWVQSFAYKRIDSAAGIILLGVAAGYLPWFLFQKRTVFSFYAIVFEPFLILGLVYCAKKFLGDPPWDRNRKIIIGICVLVIAINFIYFLPLFTGYVTSYSSWFDKMWLTSWI